MYYHRIVMDFEHGLKRDDFSEFFDVLVDGLYVALDSCRDGSDIEDREVWISGSDVTREYDRLYNTGMARFQREMNDTQAVGEFLEALHFKDYPPPKTD